MNHERKVETEVVNHYSRLWRHLNSFQTQDVIDQFLYNVDLPAPWFRDKRCLDAGCGPGYAAWTMQQLGATCHALDLGFISLNQQKRDLALGIHLNNATILQLPYVSNSFDFVFCTGVLHHTTDPRKGFFELARVTSPDGILYVTFYGRGGLYNRLVQLGRFIARFLPYEIVESIISQVIGERKVPNSFMPAKISILDNLYVPIRKECTEEEVRRWFASASFKDVIRTKTTLYNYQKPMNRFIHGQGYIQLRAVNTP
jgi:ubiquinone/menaquinone biosynthesis C-methylase UbiE